MSLLLKLYFGFEASEAANTPKPLEVKANAGNQDNMTTCEQKEKLEAKR